MGAELEYIPGRGPVIHNPVRSKADLNSLKSFDVNQALNHVMKTIKILRQELPEKTPLIGFAGAPFTVACYLIEGGSSRNYQHAKSLMYSEPKIWFALMERLTDVLADYLLGQVQSGAQALQIFDSWVGSLSPDDYRAFAQPFSARLLEKVTATDVPVIHFGTGTATLLPSMREAGGDVIGVDWRIPLDKAWEKIGHDRAIQGNLDPTLLFAPESVLERAVGRILEQAGGRPGHIFNLGHGILPGTPVENVRAVVDLVHTMSEVGEGGREG
jgi:uroporphyrinogen decarboxylase